MVDSLIEATARTIARHGLDGTTTPLIAETAGVSVGSLYQYFDDKDALISALLEKLARDLTQLFNSQISFDTEANIHEVVRKAIQLGIIFMNSNEGLYLELVRNWHRLPTERVAEVLERHVMDIGRLFFLKHYRDYPVENLQVRLFISLNSILFTMVRMISQENVLLKQEDIVEGLTEMVAGYLMGNMTGGAYGT